jgi:hypothetical protein
MMVYLLSVENRGHYLNGENRSKAEAMEMTVIDGRVAYER